MLKAKLDSVRKNKKGFSLVELIIVVAIMVALIAVLAPSYVKYVQKSRNSAVSNAAESLSTAVQTYFSDPDETINTKANFAIGVYVKAKGPLQIKWTGVDSTDKGLIEKAAGIDTTKNMGVGEKGYVIYGDYSATNGFTFSMVETTVATAEAAVAHTAGGTSTETE